MSGQSLERITALVFERLRSRGFGRTVVALRSFDFDGGELLELHALQVDPACDGDVEFELLGEIIRSERELGESCAPVVWPHRIDSGIVNAEQIAGQFGTLI